MKAGKIAAAPLQAPVRADRRVGAPYLVDIAQLKPRSPATKSMLAKKINHIIAARRLSQAQASRLLQMPQPKISAIRNCKLRGISLERLLEALADLGQHVDIVVRPATPKVPAGIRVPA
jgi:predicted XRE-type DNA-binding protein